MHLSRESVERGAFSPGLHLEQSDRPGSVHLLVVKSNKRPLPQFRVVQVPNGEPTAWDTHIW